MSAGNKGGELSMEGVGGDSSLTKRVPSPCLGECDTAHSACSIKRSANKIRKAPKRAKRLL